MRSLHSRSCLIGLVTIVVSISLLAKSDPEPVVSRFDVGSSIRHLPSAVHATRRSSGTSQATGINFAPAVAYGSGGPYAYSVAVGDFNGDGKPDLVVANGCPTSGNCTIPGTVAVLLGNGDGTFQTAVTYATGGYGADSVAVTDVNGDGKLDLVVANECSDLTNCNTTCGSGCSNGSVAVLVGNGNGTFQSAVTYGSGAEFASSVAVADLNGDGKPDLLVTNLCASSTPPTCFYGGIGVLLGNGDGTFKTAVTYLSGGFFPYSVAVADVNGDRKPDLLVANDIDSSSSPPGDVGVLLGNGDGTFQPAKTYQSTQFPLAIAVGDVNGDGKPDALLANGCFNGCNGIVSVLLGNGDGTFQVAVPYDSGSGGDGAFSVSVGDVNGDGKLDLLVANNNGSSSTVGVLPGNGDGTFQTALTFDSGGYGADSVALADVNGDGKSDIIVANYCADSTCASSSVGILINASIPPTTTVLSSSPNPSNLSQTVTLTATITVAGSQSLGVPTGTATFFDGSTSLGSSSLNGSGVASFAVSTLAGGAHSLTAAYSGDASHAPSSSTAVSQNVADFRLSTNSTTVNVGAPGGSATVELTITPKGGFNQTVSFGCSGLPAESSCSFAGTSSGATMTISTTSPSARRRDAPSARGGAVTYAMFLPALLALVSSGTRKRNASGMHFRALLCTVGFCLVYLACGGSGTNSNPGTPPGTSTVTVTADAGSISHETTITLTVQ